MAWGQGAWFCFLNRVTPQLTRGRSVSGCHHSAPTSLPATNSSEITLRSNQPLAWGCRLTVVLLRPVMYQDTGSHPRVRNHSDVCSSYEAAPTPAKATNLGTVCTSRDGVARFPHRYFHQLRDCTNSLFEPRGKACSRNSDCPRARRCAWRECI